MEEQKNGVACWWSNNRIQKQGIQRCKINQKNQVKHESKAANKKPSNKQTKKQQLQQQQKQKTHLKNWLMTGAIRVIVSS